MTGLRFGTKLAMLAATLAGCSSSGMDVDSEQVVTRNIWAGMNLESKGNGNTRVKVELNENGRSGSNIRLSPSERLEVDAAGVIVILKEDVDFADIDYEGTVPTDVGNTLFRISLFRADGTINSGSFISIPATFDIASPLRNQNFAVSERIPLSWSQASAGNQIELEVSTQCPSTSGGTATTVEWFMIGDTGTRSFNTGNLRVARDSRLVRGGICDMDITLRRERRGTLDPTFRGGGFVLATQIRSVKDLTLRLP